MHIRLLGPVRVERYGVEVHVSAPKPQAILVALSMSAGTVVPVHQLVDELWEHGPPPSAVRTVQTYVCQLRRSLDLNGGRADDGGPSSALLTRSGGYELRLGPHSVVDANRFELLATTARGLAREERLDESVRMLRTALDLWSGRPFTGLPTGPALRVAQTRLERARLGATDLWVDVRMRMGGHHDLVDDLYGLVQDNPTHEAHSEHLMITLQRCGRRTEALRVFHELRRALDTQLGVSPSSQTHEAFRTVLADDGEPVARLTRQRSSAIRLAPPTVPPAPVEMLGRDADLQRVRSAMRPGAGGSPDHLRVVELIGAPA